MLRHRSAAQRLAHLWSVPRGFASVPVEEASQTHAPAGNMEMPAFDFTPPAYNGPSKEEVLRMRKQHLSPGQLRFVAESFYALSCACCTNLEANTHAIEAWACDLLDCLDQS